MTSGVLFIESYTAGGADQIAKILLQELPFTHLTILINRNSNKKIILSKSLPKNVKVEYYNLITLPDLFERSQKISNKYLLLTAKICIHSFRYFLFLYSIFYFFIRLKRLNACIFFANNGGYPGGDCCRSASIASSFIARTRTFHIIHSMAHTAPKLIHYVERIIDFIIDKRCQVITICDAAAKQLKRVRNFKQNPIVIYNGIDQDSFSSKLSNNTIKAASDSVVRIINVGYFDYNKNQTMLIEAAGELSRRGYINFEVHFLGEETSEGLKKKCEQHVLESGLSDIIKFEGFVSNVIEWYEVSDIFVLCSNIEGFPVSVMEAMASGLPVVVTDTGGVSELVNDGVDGYIISRNNKEKLVDCLDSLVGNSHLRKKFGANGEKKISEHFTLHLMINRYAECFGLKRK